MDCTASECSNWSEPRLETAREESRQRIDRPLEVDIDGVEAEQAWSEEQHAEQDEESVSLELMIDAQSVVGQEQRDDSRSIEGWQRNQVEEHENEVHRTEHVETNGNVCVHNAAERLEPGPHDPEDEASEDGKDQVRARPCDTCKEHALPAVLEEGRIHRDRFRVTKPESEHRDHQQREQYGAKGVYVLQGVERQAPRVLRSRVAQKVGDIAMGNLMKHDCGQNHHEHDGAKDQFI